MVTQDQENFLYDQTSPVYKLSCVILHMSEHLTEIIILGIKWKPFCFLERQNSFLHVTGVEVTSVVVATLSNIYLKLTLQSWKTASRGVLKFI